MVGGTNSSIPVQRINRKEKIPIIGLDLGETSNNYSPSKTVSETGGGMIQMDGDSSSMRASITVANPPEKSK